ncbi:aspartate racemase [Salmonella enterica]|nr:aspartate racemase [Salmonella enterica]
MNFSIGILAGMGPRSTGPFIDLIITECQLQYGALYDMDYPEMHIISLPTPFYPDKIIDNEKMVQVLKYGVSSLVSSGVSLIVVPCNFAHKYFSEMLKVSLGTPLFHITDAALMCIPKDALNVAVIGTAPTLDIGLYQERIFNSGKKYVSSNELRSRTTELINLIKEKGFENRNVIDSWLTLLSCVDSLDVDALLIACTDISPLMKKTVMCNHHFVIVDTSRSLAASAVKAYCNRGKG